MVVVNCEILMYSKNQTAFVCFIKKILRRPIHYYNQVNKYFVKHTNVAISVKNNNTILSLLN